MSGSDRSCLDSFILFLFSKRFFHLITRQSFCAVVVYIGKKNLDGTDRVTDPQEEYLPAQLKVLG